MEAMPVSANSMNGRGVKLSFWNEDPEKYILVADLILSIQHKTTLSNRIHETANSLQDILLKKRGRATDHIRRRALSDGGE